MNIKSKLITSYLIIIIFSVGFLGFWLGNKAQNQLFNEIQDTNKQITDLIYNIVSVRNDLLSDKIFSDLYFAEKLLNNLGETKIDPDSKRLAGSFNVPTLYVGSSILNNNDRMLSEIKDSTGASSSIFVVHEDKLVRIASNLNTDNTSLVGSFIPNSSEIFTKLSRGEIYYGRNLIAGNYYITGYKPLFFKGNLVGAIALGYTEINSYLKATLDNIVIGKKGYVYIINSKGDLLYHPSNKEMKNMIDYDFCKKIIENKKGTISYNFDDTPKIATYTYFEPWDWYIVTTANYSDLKSSSNEFLVSTITIGLLIVIFTSILSLIFANKLLKPINKLKNYMEIARKGDLSVHSDIKTKDEFGILSNSFNKMIKENKRLLEEIRQYDRLKTEFIANMSHELRTPLNIIFSTSQLFSLYINKDISNVNTEKIMRYNDIIRQNCYRLLRLVNNLIDITKIDSGFMELNLSNKNIVEVVENITLSTVEYIESNSRNIIFDTDVEEKFMAFDPEKMERIILNLISNAIKFTKPGDLIEVKIKDKGDKILIFVKDTGIGIPENKINNIFERFKQVDPLLIRSHEGSGIGLSIVKSLVEMHLGTINVTSVYGEGTEFSICLPVNEIEENQSKTNIENFSQRNNIEKIQIEFSDIYN